MEEWDIRWYSVAVTIGDDGMGCDGMGCLRCCGGRVRVWQADKDNLDKQGVVILVAAVSYCYCNRTGYKQAERARFQLYLSGLRGL